MITCERAIKEEFKDQNQILTTRQLIDQVQDKYPGKWKEITIRTHLIGCSINHQSSKFYPTFQKFLYNIEPGKVRLFDSEKDDKLKKLSAGLKIQFLSEEMIPNEEKTHESKQTILNNLRINLRRDIGQLEPGLKLFQEEGFDSLMEAAKIDILGKDVKDNLVVIMLRGNITPISTLNQIVNSMASIKNELGERNIRSIIVAKDFDNEIILASRKMTNVSLVRYKIKSLLSQRYSNKVNWLPIGTSGNGMRPDERACKIGVFSKSVTLKICKIV